MKRNNLNHINNHNNNKIASIEEKKYKVICKQTVTELRVSEISKELTEIKPNFKINSDFRFNSLNSTPLTILQNHLTEKLTKIKTENSIENFQLLPSVDTKINPLFFPFQIQTSDKIIINNLKSVLMNQFVLNYYKQIDNTKIDIKEYNLMLRKIIKIYEQSHELKLYQVFNNSYKEVVPFLHNESGKFRSHELIQGIGVSQVLKENNINLHAKTEPGSGDFNVLINGNYVILDIKSADLSDSQIKDLLSKIINRYNKFEKSYICLNGNKNQIQNLIETENIIIPNNIELIYQNTEESFNNKGFYNVDSLNKIKSLSNLYNQLAQPKFVQQVEKLIRKNTHKEQLDLTAFEKELNELIDLDSFIDCQNEGDNFFDSETISDFKKFTSHFNDNNDNDGTGE